MPSRRTIPTLVLRSLLASLLLLGFAPRTAAAQSDAVFFAYACPHDGWVNVSRYRCSDSLLTFEPSAIKSVTFTTTLKDGRTFTQELPPGTDALFLSNVALQKFLLPYYRGVKNTAYTASITAYMKRAEVDARARRAAELKKKG